MRVVVVGAGLAGLTAARSLVDAHDVVVIDKGRGVGGRMATRRIGDATFDHGAQFFTTHTEEFAADVTGWEAAGIARPWFRGGVGPLGVTDVDGHTRFRGVDTMNGVARHLAGGLDVRTATTARAVARRGDGWVVTIGDDTLQADAVVLTPPVPQSLSLLEAGGVALADDDDAALRSIRYEPCLAVLAALDASPRLPDPGAVDPDSGPIDWMADNQRKGVSAAPAITIHATAEFSREHWDSPDEQVIAKLLAAAGFTHSPVAESVQVQRWRYARPVQVHPTRCLVAHDLPPLVFAGDAFGGAKVEGAVLSGRSAATALASLRA